MGYSAEAKRNCDEAPYGVGGSELACTSKATARKGKTSHRAMRVVLSVAIALLATFSASALLGCADNGSSASSSVGSSKTSVSSNSKSSASNSSVAVTENGTYTSKDEVAAYIHEFGHLPSNFISKTKARNQGWDSDKGNLDKVCPGKSIGGSKYYNDDGQLPDKSGRTWTECDINYDGGYRGAERIVFSNDGLVYYTGDHYKTFERLY